jgi:hypothetical protein
MLEVTAYCHHYSLDPMPPSSTSVSRAKTYLEQSNVRHDAGDDADDLRVTVKEVSPVLAEDEADGTWSSVSSALPSASPTVLPNVFLA